MSTGPLSKESRAALRRVTSQMVADYLTARGLEYGMQWERIWDPNYDYEQRMGDCIRCIATAEGRDHISVLSDILGESLSGDVWQADYLGDVVQIRQCSECPFRELRDHSRRAVCTRANDRQITRFTDPPNWCPLIGGLTLYVEEK